MIDQTAWVENNEKHLAATINWIRLRLGKLSGTSEKKVVRQVATVDDDSSRSWFKRKKAEDNKLLPLPSTTPMDEKIEQARQEILKYESDDELVPSLILLSRQLGLSKFDSNVLALCAAMHLDTSIAGLCANALNDQSKPYPTFSLAFALFENPDWNTLSPHAALRYWRLLEINQPGNTPLTNASLGADERIVNYLKGLNYIDDRLTPLMDPVRIQLNNEKLPNSQGQIVESLMTLIQSSSKGSKTPVIELLGHDSPSKHLIANKVSSELGLSLQMINIKALPKQMGDFEAFARLWQRESLLMPLALYVDSHGSDVAEKYNLKRFLDRSNGLVFIDVDDTKTSASVNHVSIEVNKPTPIEQEQLWNESLQGHSIQTSNKLVEQFSFNQSEISRLASSVLSSSDDKDSIESFIASDLDAKIWQACRIAARSGMEKLAKRIDVKSHWDQLVLPAEQKTLITQISNQVAQRTIVYETWGFRKQMNRGLGITALFSGASGTGKTMAAEVIANTLNLDLYRIDLSSVVSKFIGETEKNLCKLFDAAEDSGAILFFDEADALFGKRSEVKDSHDRYANIEINYLLQRLESYKGLAILATNMKNALDKAFVRRLRFSIDFPFPDGAQREELWKKVFPANTPLDESFDYKRLAKLNLTGGNIHNVAMNAAFLAAQANSKITMPLIMNAARTEYKKLERPVKESNFNWFDARQA